MTRDEVWQSLPEFHILTQIAERLEIEIRLHGSLAERLLRIHPPNASAHVSMLDFVEAFGDIELSVPPRAIGQVTELIRANIPEARFFRWDIGAQTKVPEHEVLSYLRLYPLAEIAFGAGPMSHTHLRCVYIKNEFQVQHNEGLLTQKTDVFWKRREATSPIDALVDLLDLASSYPDLLDHPLVSNVRDRVSEGTAELSTLVPETRTYETLVVSVLRFLYREETRVPPPRWLTALCGALSTNVTDPRLKDLLRHCDGAQSSEPLAVVVRGHSEHGVWRRDIQALQLLRSETAWRRQSVALIRRFTPDGSPPFRLSPVLSVGFEDGPERDCCRYEDFARGTVEIAWLDPDGPSWPASSAFVLVDASDEKNPDAGSTVPDDDTLAIAHAYATFRQTGAIRSDYGFLSILAAPRREVNILAASPV